MHRLTALSLRQMQKFLWQRFDGKKVIECQVSDGINKADELIKRAVNGDAPV